MVAAFACSRHTSAPVPTRTRWWVRLAVAIACEEHTNAPVPTRTPWWVRLTAAIACEEHTNEAPLVRDARQPRL